MELLSVLVEFVEKRMSQVLKCSGDSLLQIGLLTRYLDFVHLPVLLTGRSVSESAPVSVLR
jgi:hypothetical protein